MGFLVFITILLLHVNPVYPQKCSSLGNIGDLMRGKRLPDSVKQHQPDSEDGEYWLRLPNFSYYITRLFCLGMAAPSPQEFLTLKNINYGNYPIVTKNRCSGETPLGGLCRGEGGEIWFNKISVDVTTMQVNQTDFTFAIYSNIPLTYGVAQDCYTVSSDVCDAQGFFRIDLRGTGWKVRENQQWEIFYGYKPKILSIARQHNNSYIELSCGGYPGGCRPVNGLYLHPFPEDGPSR